jgi:hypothetical protein
MALTDTEIRRAKKKEKPYKLSDGGNLFLWVTPSGGKLWRWAYRHEGKEKLMTFGRYPEVSLALARERHLQARSLLAVGVDPMAERKAVKSAAQIADENSFANLAGAVDGTLAAREESLPRGFCAPTHGGRHSSSAWSSFNCRDRLI